MITIPSVKPDLLFALETDFGTTIAATIWRQLKAQEQWLNAQLPLGLILYFYSSQTYAGGGGIAAPNACWRLCNGGTVTDPESPLYGAPVPSMMDIFPRDGNAIGATGGSNTFTPPFHNHGGLTSFNPDYDDGSKHSDDHDEKPAGTNHRHAVDGQAFGAQLTMPLYLDLQPYMRVK